MIRILYSEFNDIYADLYSQLLDAPAVDVGEWHAQDVRGIDHAVSRELRNVVFEMNVSDDVRTLQDVVEPNLPWAEEHFQERVGGEPLNPPPSHVRWPWASANEKHQTQEGGAFSHSYPERMWPIRAGAYQFVDDDGVRHDGIHPPHHGIRYKYGDLHDLVQLLIKNPMTRQAYLPIWFPEDLTAAREGERVPCTLGYHFLIREGKMHITYPIRSCDFLRYFQDDVYLACRLGQWVCDQLCSANGDIYVAEMGTLTMMINSLHVFAGDLMKMERGEVELRQRSADRT